MIHPIGNNSRCNLPVIAMSSHMAHVPKGASGVAQAQLTSLTRDFTATSAAAQRTLKGLFGRRPAKPVVDADAVPTAQLRPGYGASAGMICSSSCMAF